MPDLKHWQFAIDHTDNSNRGRVDALTGIDTHNKTVVRAEFGQVHSGISKNGLKLSSSAAMIKSVRKADAKVSSKVQLYS